MWPSITIRSLGMSLMTLGILGTAIAQEAPQTPVPLPPPPLPLFLREAWRLNPGENAANQKAVSNPNLELKFYDPLAQNIPAYEKDPPADSRAADWHGPSCIQLAQLGTNPIELWTGVCQGPVVVTLRDKNNYVDLTGLAKIRWTTRVSGFHAMRPAIKLADGTWLVGDHTSGNDSTNSTMFLDSEFALATVRWLKLDIARVATRGFWVEKPDLSKVDEIGFAELMRGSGHGWGGFVGLGPIEVYGKPVKR
jgi:hypothetical protein